MTQPKPTPPSLTELMARFLNNQMAAQASGLEQAESVGEVMPFDAVPVQSVDPQAAWDAAIAVLSFEAAKVSLKAPPHWGQLVATHEPELALPFCVGNFPQLLRNYHPVLHQTKLSELRPAAGRPFSQPGLVEWANEVAAKGETADVLVAAACLRLTKEFDAARTILTALEPSVAKSWRAVLQNEKAALAWHSGRAEEALKLWQSQPASNPALFNRGMAFLFSDRPRDAVEALTKAVGQLPEANPWHHLGRLYLVLAA